jgi:hypothetical protein
VGFFVYLAIPLRIAASLDLCLEPVGIMLAQQRASSASSQARSECPRAISVSTRFLKLFRFRDQPFVRDRSSVDTASSTQYTVRSLVKGAAFYQAWTFSRLAIKATTLVAEGVKAAVLAAITQPWSNGQVEAQITKLKLVKRQMYGRAKLDLLQARLIGAP